MANAKNETVSLMIPRVPGDGDANVFVGINGKTYLIRRGEEVAVPANVAAVLQRREKALAAALEFEAQAAQPLQALQA